MKNKFILALGIVASGLANAQTGKVGINTVSPKETLEVNGTLRVDDLPTSGTGKVYSGNTTKATDFIATKSLVADVNGNVGVMSFNTTKTMIIPNAKNAGQFNLSPTEYDRFNGFLFDGNSNLDVVLPKAEDGKSIFFYGYGGGGDSLVDRTYKFTGTDTHNLSSPPSSVSNYPFGVQWSPRNPEQNNILTLYQPKGTVRFRYTKIEFIAIGDKWYYVHPNYIHRNM